MTRSHRFRRAHAGRQGAERHAALHAARRAGGGGDRARRSRARRRSTPAEIDDVILGCAMPEAEQGLNVARIASLRAGVPSRRRPSRSTASARRACRRSPLRAERIMCGAADAIVAGGTESMSLVPMGGHKIAPNPTLVDSYPDVYLTTGLVAENHARELRDLARGAGRVRAAQPPARARGDRRRPLRATRRVSRRSASLDRCRRRRAAARHVAGGAREAAAGVPREGHGHGRQLVADERRRRRGRRDERRARCARSG